MGRSGKAWAVLALGTLATWMAMGIGVSVWHQVLRDLRPTGTDAGRWRAPPSTCRLPRPPSAPVVGAWP